MKIKVITSAHFSSNEPDLAIQHLNDQLGFIDNIESFSNVRMSFFKSSYKISYDDKVIAYLTVKLK